MKIKTPPLRFESLVVHGGGEPAPYGPTTIPIVQSSAFAYETADAMEDAFTGRKASPVYTRLGNPTTGALEKRLALLEGGFAAVATSSGMAAIATAVMSIVRSGDEILASSSLFGGTFSLFRDTLSNYGITTRFVDPTDASAIRNGVTDRTRLIFVETIGNPKIDVPDISAIGKVAGEAEIPLVVDATVCTPYLARGCDLGADIIVHSTSKYINGAGSAIGGAVIDMGRFGWRIVRAPFASLTISVWRGTRPISGMLKRW
jgi:O-acetylhomoserine (thiol)-lyase